MKPKHIVIIAALAVWGFLGVTSVAQAQAPNPDPPTLNLTLSKVASTVAHRPVVVWCWPPEVGASNGWSRRQVWLAAEDCRRLSLLEIGFRPQASAKFDFAKALGDMVVITHLSLRTGSPRLAVERGIERVEAAARALGVGPGYAKELHSMYFRYVEVKMPWEAVISGGKGGKG